MSRFLGHLGLVSLLLASCRQPVTAPPPPPPATSPPAALIFGLVDSAGTIRDLAGDAPLSTPARFVAGNGDALLADLEAGIVDAVIGHVVPADADFWFSPVAVDGLVILVHPDNPVRDLSLGQVRAIFAGELASWADVGGPPQPIVLLGRETGAAARRILEERVLAEARLAITTRVVAGDAHLQAAVAAEPAAIGYGMMGQLSPDIVPLTLDGVLANPTMTASQTYALSAPIYFISREEPLGAARAWLAWLQSDEGQATLGAAYGRVR